MLVNCNDCSMLTSVALATPAGGCCWSAGQRAARCSGALCVVPGDAPGARYKPLLSAGKPRELLIGAAAVQRVRSAPERETETTYLPTVAAGC